MLAIVAAVVFGLALLAEVDSDVFTLRSLSVLGQLLMAPHLAGGVGTSFGWRNRGSYRGRRR